MRKKKTNEINRQIHLIHQLATRLPWIVVAVIILVMILTLIEAFLGKG